MPSAVAATLWENLQERARGYGWHPSLREGWKDFGPTTEKKYIKFCGECRKRTSVKLKEEKHSSN